MPTYHSNKPQTEQTISELFLKLSNNDIIGIDSDYSGVLPDINTLQDDLDEVTSDSAETSPGASHINVKETADKSVNISFFEDGAKRSSSMFVCTLKQREDDSTNEVDYPLCLVQTVVSCCHRSQDGKMGIEKTDSKIHLILHKRLLERLGGNKPRNLKESINSIANFDICDVVSFDPDEKENAAAKATQLLRSQEAALIEEMAANGKLNENNWMIVDGPLSIKEAESQNLSLEGYRYMVGVEKSFHDKYENRPFAQTINTLPEGYRTPAYIPKSKRGKAKVALWYLRLRRPDRPNDRSHIVACELLIPEGQDKIDTDLINRVSKAVLNEAYPLCYGADERWKTHLYPVFVTEKACKSIFHSKEILDGILK